MENKKTAFSPSFHASWLFWPSLAPRIYFLSPFLCSPSSSSSQPTPHSIWYWGSLKDRALPCPYCPFPSPGGQQPPSHHCHKLPVLAPHSSEHEEGHFLSEEKEIQTRLSLAFILRGDRWDILKGKTISPAWAEASEYFVRPLFLLSQNLDEEPPSCNQALTAVTVGRDQEHPAPPAIPPPHHPSRRQVSWLQIQEISLEG